MKVTLQQKNNPDLKPVVDQAVDNVKGQAVINEKPYLFGEDFSFYREIAPSYFVFVGAKDEAKGFNSSLHTSTFNFDERVLMSVVDYYEEILKAY
jgi:metal-dependent amidase/aminoacylase/carboxypeptidase family protein